MVQNTIGVFSSHARDTTKQTIRLTVTGDEGFKWSAVIETSPDEKITALALRKFRECHPGIHVTFPEKTVPDTERDNLLTMSDITDWF